MTVTGPAPSVDETVGPKRRSNWRPVCRCSARIHRRGTRQMFVVTPMSVTGTYGFIALASWIALDGDHSWLVTQLLGLTSMALGICAFIGVLKLVLNRDPFDSDYKPSEQSQFATVH